MSTARRLISGSAATWVQIVVIFASQIILVPVYLSFWGVQTYGIWLAVQAIIFVGSIFDRGHIDFLGFEFLRIGNNNPEELGLYLGSGIWFGIAVSLLQIIAIVFLIFTNSIHFLLDTEYLANPHVIKDASIVLLLQSIAWLLTGSPSGLFIRTLSVFGYYPRMVWWGIFNSLVMAVVPLIAIVLGAGLLMTGIVTAVATIFASIPQYLDMNYLLRKEGITFSRSSFRVGWQNCSQSVALSLKYILENFRQQSIRIILAPISGAAALAAFSTMRTGANVALQGVNSIANPLMPDFMRFLHDRDQARSDASLGIVWILVVAILAPAVLLVQVFIEPLFVIWTRGRISFEPRLFATLSLCVLVYAAAQPAMAVVYGNNLLRFQLLISISAAIAVVGGIILFVPMMNLLGAGVALLIAELVAAFGNLLVARHWMKKNGLRWPGRLFAIVSGSIGLVTLGMLGLVYLPQIKWFILISSLTLLMVNIWIFWNTLPSFATYKAKKTLTYIFNLRKLRIA